MWFDTMHWHVPVLLFFDYTSAVHWYDYVSTVHWYYFYLNDTVHSLHSKGLVSLHLHKLAFRVLNVPAYINASYSPYVILHNALGCVCSIVVLLSYVINTVHWYVFSVHWYCLSFMWLTLYTGTCLWYTGTTSQCDWQWILMHVSGTETCTTILFDSDWHHTPVSAISIVVLHVLCYVMVRFFSMVVLLCYVLNLICTLVWLSSVWWYNYAVIDTVHWYMHRYNFLDTVHWYVSLVHWYYSLMWLMFYTGAFS
jgi:hypothetical protein